MIATPTFPDLAALVVDESLYALKEDSTNIKEFFWGPKPNRVGTAFSFSGYYYGGLEKEDVTGVERAVHRCLIHNTLLHPPKIELAIKAAETAAAA